MKFKLKLSLFFSLIAASPIFADGLPCKDVSNQILTMSVLHYLYTDKPTLNKIGINMMMLPDTKLILFTKYFVNKAKEEWVSNANGSLISHITKEEEVKVSASFNSLNDIIGSGPLANCDTLLELKQIQDKAINRYEVLLKEVIEELKDKATDLNRPTTNSVFDLKESAKDESSIKEEVRNFVNEYLSDSDTPEKKAKDIEALTKTVLRIKKSYKNRGNEGLLAEVVNTYATALDPHTEYQTPTTSRAFNASMSNNIAGIGAMLEFPLESPYPKIMKIVKGGAASSHAIKAKENNEVYLQKDDSIEAVSQDNVTYKETADLELMDITDMIKGTAGTDVYLKIKRKDVADSFVIKIKREKFKTDFTNPIYTTVISQKDSNGQDRKIGIIRFLSFTGGDEEAKVPGIDEEVKDATLKLKEQGAEAIVLDIRSNGGGSLGAVASMADSFIAQGITVETKDSRGNIRQLPFEQNPDIDFSGPLVIAINKGSASASEILSGSLKDYKRALIVGDESTYGKGSVQNVLNAERAPRFGIVGQIKLTIEGFFLPSGRSNQFTGVSSDVVIPSVKRDLQKPYWESGYKNAIQFQPIDSFANMKEAQGEGEKAWTPLTKEIIQEVANLSANRLSKDSDAQKIASINKEIDSIVAKKSLTVGDNLALRKKIKDLFPSKTKKEGDENNEELDEDNATLESLKYKPQENLQDREILAIAADLTAVIGKTNTQIRAPR